MSSQGLDGRKSFGDSALSASEENGAAFHRFAPCSCIMSCTFVSPALDSLFGLQQHASCFENLCLTESLCHISESDGIERDHGSFGDVGLRA